MNDEVIVTAVQSDANIVLLDEKGINEAKDKVLELNMELNNLW